MDEDSEGIIFKAYNGDRKKNLEAIAEEFRQHFADREGQLEPHEFRRLSGYCDQLDIIAEEWDETKVLDAVTEDDIEQARRQV